MAGPTSIDAVMGRFQTRGDDFLHFLSASGSVTGGVDSTGTGFGTMTGGLIPPPSKILFVDMNRFDSYTPNGCILKPFKTIADAINQIILDGDNSTSNIYCVYLFPGIYSETVILENPALVSLVFFGIGSASVAGIRSQANNSNLQQVDMRHLGITGGSISLSGSGSFLASGLNFYDCNINVPTFTETGGGGCQFFDTTFASAVTLTSVPNFLYMGNRGPQTGSSFSLTGSVLTVQRGCRNGATVSIDATSTYFLGNGARQDGAVTVNGTFNNRLGTVNGAITVNAGGSYNELGAFHTNSLTLSGGSYTQTGILGVGSLQMGGVHVSTGSGTPNGAITGSPGDLYINTAGGSLITLWVKETGIATNSGWIGK